MMSNHQTCHPNHIFGQIAALSLGKKNSDKPIQQRTATLQVNFEPQFWRGMVLMRFNTTQMIRLGQLGTVYRPHLDLYLKKYISSMRTTLPYAVPG
jgi:hypothetical protein